MSRNIEEYLDELRRQLSGTDPALAQDALYDAEEYLRTESAALGGAPSEEQFAGIVEVYGTPEEVADAYRETELTVARALKQPKPVRTKSAWAGFFGVVADPGAWGALFYALLSLATGVLYFSVVVTGLSTSLGLAILVIGLPVALLFLAIVRAFSLVEGRLVEALLGVRMPRRPRIVPGADAGDSLMKRIKAWLTDYRTWTTILYMALQLPLGIAYFTAAVSAASVSAWFVVSPALQLAWDVPMFVDGSYGYFLQPWAIPFSIAAGVLGFIVTLHAAKLIGKVHAAYAKVMLVGRFSEPAERG